MANLDFATRTWGPFTILTPRGELDLHTQVEFEQVVTEHLFRSPLVVDLSQMDFIAITALRSLLICHAQAESVDQVLLLAGVPRQTQRLLTLSGLDGVLPVRASVTEAVCTSTLVGTAAPFGDLSALDAG